MNKLSITQTYSGTKKASQSFSPDSDSYNNLLDNDIIKNLPKHLRQFIVDQNYTAYTPIDHAVWRYVLRQNHRFLKDYAHKIYFVGLEKTGLKIESIPSIAEMNTILSKIGWAAVTVNGFIPPAAFMEFQAHRVLVIAADMRQLHHIEYTPSPDIIHEAAGHAPVIADPKYAEYLRQIGQVGTKAMSSKKDFELYEAIRKLSILKELPNVDMAEIEKAEKDVLHKQKTLGKPSEMALLSRLHWWTVEYGLIGDLNNPKIYGAGLLSSIGEATYCFSNDVKKLPYNLDTVNYPFDITTMQPQLFVTPNFEHLIDVLEQFASKMAYRVGGLKGIKKAIECENISTCVYSSGLQISGRFTEVLSNNKNEPIYINTIGPGSFAYNDTELPDHNKLYHEDGFGSPVGCLKDTKTPLESFSDNQLKELKIIVGQSVKLSFESGVNVFGNLIKIVRKNNRIILMIFDQCRVTYQNEVLFNKSQGRYPMAVGEKIISVFSGAADKDANNQPLTVSKMRLTKTKYNKKTLKLHKLYQNVRDYREKNADQSVLPKVWQELATYHPDDWLLPVEILEILVKDKLYQDIEVEIKKNLKARANKEKKLNKLIKNGLRFIYDN